MLGEQIQDLRQSLPVPNGPRPVHWRCDEVLPGGVGLAKCHHGITEVLKKRLHTLGDRSRPLARGDEVVQAPDDADGGLVSDLLQRVREDLQLAAGEELSSADRWIGTARGLVNVATNVGITDEGIDSNLRHRDEE